MALTLIDAKKQARRFGCFIADKGGVFLLYRSMQPRNILVGKHATVNGIAALVSKVCRPTPETDHAKA